MGTDGPYPLTSELMVTIFSVNYRRLWIVVPSLVVVQLGKDIAASFVAGEKRSNKLASGKTQ